MRLMLKSALAVIVGISTAYVAVAGVNHWPSGQNSWYKGKFLFFVAVSVIALNVARTVVGEALNAFSEDRAESMRRILEAELLTLWQKLETQIDPVIEASRPSERDALRRLLRDRLGLRIWTVPKWHLWLGSIAARRLIPDRKRRCLPTPAMILAARFHLEDLSQPTQIAWRRGVGAIGESWTLRDKFFFSIDEQWRDKSVEELELLTDQGRLGLDVPQIQRLLQFGQVFVTPIWKSVRGEGRSLYAGCITVDLPQNTTSIISLEADEIYEITLALSKVVAKHI